MELRGWALALEWAADNIRVNAVAPAVQVIATCLATLAIAAAFRYPKLSY